LRTLATSLVNPVLYLVAFGYGLGGGISFDGYNYLSFVMPGIIALTAMSSSYNGAGLKLHVDRLFYRCFDEYLMSPISLLSLAIGKTLIGVVRGLISTVAILAVGIIITPTLMVTPLFLLVLVISCFVFSFLGVLIGMWAKSHQDMTTFGTIFILPMTFLSGTFFSLSQLPEAVKAVLYLLPLTHSSECLRAEALGQAFPWLSFVALVGFGVLFLAGSIWLLKRASI